MNSPGIGALVITSHTEGQSVWVAAHLSEPLELSAPAIHRLPETLTPPPAGPR